MESQKRQDLSDDFAGGAAVIVQIEPVCACRVIDKTQRQITGQRLHQEAVERAVQPELTLAEAASMPILLVHPQLCRVLPDLLEHGVNIRCRIA